MEVHQEGGNSRDNLYLEDKRAEVSLLKLSVVLLLGPERDELIDVINVDVDSPANKENAS